MITNRTQADVNNIRLDDWQPSKGAYNYTDLNRVEAKVKELNDLLVTYSYMQPLTTKLDWTRTDFFTQSDSQRYLNNVKAVRQALATYTGTPEAPSTMAHLTYQGANDIERILVDIERLVINLQAWFVYSGVANSGQSRVWQNRFRHFAIRESTVNQYFPAVSFESWIFDSSSATNDTDVGAVFKYEESYNRVWEAKNLIKMSNTSYTSRRAFTPISLTADSVRGRNGETSLMLTIPQSDEFKPTSFPMMLRYCDTVAIYGVYNNGANNDLILDTTTTYKTTQTNVTFTPQDTGKYYTAFEFYFSNEESGTTTTPQIKFIRANGQLRQNVYRLYSFSWAEFNNLAWEDIDKTWGDFN